jgi:hypothetical protein
MADKREDIILRLIAIAGTITGIQSVLRNRGQANNTMRPCVIVLDGDETVYRSKPLPPARGVMMSPSIMTMTPEIYILLKEDRPTNEEVGPDINAFRIALISAIASDAGLRALLGPNGSLSFNGTTTDLKSGGQLAGQMKLDFSFNYVFNPN